jgi:cobalt-zinc-cadmium efflux system outer membrane protein
MKTKSILQDYLSDHYYGRGFSLENRTFVCTFARLLLIAVFSVGASLSTVRAVSIPPALTALIEEAYHNNQELLSMEENAQALLAEAPFAGSLQDPVVGFGLLNVPVDSFDLDQEAMTQKLLFVAQKFPWFGTLDLRQQIVELNALEAGFRVQDKRLELAENLAKAWYEIGFIRESLLVNENLKVITTQILRVAEARYGTGKGLQQDILTGQVQISELVDEEVNLESQELAVRAKIGGILNRGSAFTDEGPNPISDFSDVPKSEMLNRAALQFNPLLQARRAAIDRARVEVQLAEKAYLPDIDLRLSYGQREDNPLTGDDRADFVSATMAITVPLWQSTRQDSKRDAAKKRLAAAEKSLLGLETTLPHSIDRILAEIEGAQNNYGLYRDALSVQAAHLADASMAAYAVGKVEFNTMLSARVQLLRIELGAEKYKYRIYKKLAELEKLIGTNLSTLEGL